MTIGILKEPQGENRVSMLPEAVAQLVKKGITVWVEKGAGERSFSSDNDYEKAGAVVLDNEGASHADIYLSIQPPALRRCAWYGCAECRGFSATFRRRA